ncbi:uncharacterized protein LOC113794241 [Dermatophagoides pteronyssinus]|uniref:uncharacterized protein LOC113794241 n=1 Tax=Dermatophagoides pteronyssinus TaxID=6956 RepID=UPI003F6616D8
MIRTNIEKKPSKHGSTTTTTTTTSFRAPPSRDANNYYHQNQQQQKHHENINRSRSNFDGDDNEIIYDETWPLDQVINKIDLKSDDSDNDDDNRPYNIEIENWHSGPQLLSNTFDSGRNLKRLPGNGQLYSSWNQGSQTWKDKSVQHRKYKIKKNPSITKLNKSIGSSLSYDMNNNYLDMDITYDNDNDNVDFIDDYDSSILLRDVGIQCNLKKYPESIIDSIRNEFTTTTAPKMIVTNKPPIKVIKSSNNGIVSTFSDVPKLSSPSPIDLDLDLDQRSSSIRSTDVIYSQIDKSHKSNNNRNGGGGNINIVYKQPLNISKQQQTSFDDNSNSMYDIKTKQFGFDLNNPNFRKIPLPNPNENLWPESSSLNQSTINQKQPKYDKEVLEETISISNSSTDESLIHNHDIRMKPKESRKMKNKNNSMIGHHKKNDENILLENNSLRLKSSKSPYSERLHKSNADLREQFLQDETRGGLAAAYKNRQQQKQHQQQQQQNNRHRTLSLNRMNAANVISNDENRQQQHYPPVTVKPNRHLSQSHLSSRYSDLGVENGQHSHPPRSLSSSSRSRSVHHERDPIVMLIPPANNHNDQSQRLTSILRNNSTKSNITVQSKAKKSSRPQLKSQSKINLKDFSTNADSKKSNSEKQQRVVDLNRRYSMPKDTKFNWLNKFKLKK